MIASRPVLVFLFALALAACANQSQTQSAAPAATWTATTPAAAAPASPYGPTRLVKSRDGHCEGEVIGNPGAKFSSCASA